MAKAFLDKRPACGTRSFFDKRWHELSRDEVADAERVYHQALVRFLKAMGENPFTPENHARLARISSISAAHCRKAVAVARRSRMQ
ncbi:hypothetical protein [Rhodoplanes roseus]|uniref:Uncharacterized protein n=1 Tax=Rhodoplanes roseus TaxID=29409 RepID=A0A327KUN6_9BRAD|nr:hypothetical protein [Rhodoplanes roseus]RAI41165.1 hypothetical protein CH341_22250 [Rhodoplanes roseus]